MSSRNSLYIVIAHYTFKYTSIYAVEGSHIFGVGMGAARG